MENIRRELLEFSYYQESILSAYDFKGGWKSVDNKFLLLCMMRNALALMYLLNKDKKDISDPFAIRKACGDIANYAMMIWDNNGGISDGK